MDPSASIPNPATTSNASVKPPKAPRAARANTRDDLDTQHSKTLSYILRHGAAKESLTLRDDGFVRVADLVRFSLARFGQVCGTEKMQLEMKRPKLKHCDLETLGRIVRDNAKQRFTMRGEMTGVNGEEEMWIRANQGHSVAVSPVEVWYDLLGDVLIDLVARRWKISS